MINYPYPVMTDGSDCYLKNTVVWSGFEKEISGSDLTIRVLHQFDDERIQALVDSGLAKPLVLVCCPRTDYRQLFDISEHEIVIDSGRVAGSVNVELSLIATEDIDCSQIGDLSEDYSGLSVSVPRNGYISKCDYVFSIDRELEPDSKSICKFIKDDNVVRVTYDDCSDFILIRLPGDLYYKFMTLTPDAQSIYTSIFFPPVLVDLIGRYWKDKDAVPPQFLWYDVINKTIETKYPGCDLSSPEYSAHDIMESILDSLIVTAANKVSVLNGGE